MLPNISVSKNNHAMILGQLLEYNMRNVFLEKSGIKWSRETSSRSVSAFFKKVLYKVKAYGQYFKILIYFGRPQLGQ